MAAIGYKKTTLPEVSSIGSAPMGQSLDAYSDSDTEAARRIRDLGASSDWQHVAAYRNMGGDARARELDARSALRRGLSRSVDEAPGLLGEESDLLKSEARSALQEGLRKTRANYNDRGLLYSGLQQAGSESTRSGVKSALASSLAGARRDNENLLDRRKEALASLGLQSQAQNLELADQALETSMRNRIARRQAFQQFAGGVGAVAGRAYGNRVNRPSNTSDPEGY